MIQTVTTGNFVIIGLLAVNTMLVGSLSWFLRRYMIKNDEAHKEFYIHGDRLIKIETEHSFNHPK